jgi:glutathione S-transferase
VLRRLSGRVDRLGARGDARPALRLYGARWSTNVQRVTMALAHKGLRYESVTISYDDRSRVERVSGQPLVPVLVDDGTVVVDSMRIVAHLEDRFPERPLYPADPARRAELDVFVDWFNRVWKVEPNEIEAELAAGEHGSAERVAALGATMDERLDTFERMLTGRDFVFGEFGAADCCAFPFLKYAAGRDADDDEPFHRVLAEHQSLGGRPGLAAWIDRVAAVAPRAG